MVSRITIYLQSYGEAQADFITKTRNLRKFHTKLIYGRFLYC